MKPKVALLFCLTLASCGDQLTPKSIETPRGTVTYKELVRADGKLEARVRDLDPSENAQLKQSAGMAPTFVAKYVPAAQRQDDVLDNLDVAFAAWLNSPVANREPAAEVERIVGAALGEYCIQRFPVRWVVAADDRGSEFMILGENPQIWSYPMAAVRYRIEDRKTDFIAAMYEAFVHLHKKSRGP